MLIAAAAMRRLSWVSEDDEGEEVSNGDHNASRAKA